MASGTQTTSRDAHFLAHAFRLAEQGVGLTAPNPSVGAIIVAGDNDAGVIIGVGITGSGGRPHAETVALAMAGAGAQGATLYVSLEPCSHHAKTPPCARAIIDAGMARVVVGAPDPDARVAGRGLAALRSAGLDVVEAFDLAGRGNAGHVSRVSRGRPRVSVKIALSSDDRMALGDGRPVWVTGPQARARGHLLRARSDAILVGVGTILADNPGLDCRLPGFSHASPIPVVLDSFLRTPLSSRLVAAAHRTGAIVFTSASADADEVTRFEGAGCVMETVGCNAHGRLALNEVLARLAERGITRLLVEGGPTVVAAFLDAGLVDEFHLFRGAAALEAEGIVPFGEAGLGQVTASADWDLGQTLAVGEDRLLVYQRASGLTGRTAE